MNIKCIIHLRCAPFIGIAVVFLLTACNRMEFDGFNASEKKEITKNVVLHRTSGSDVTLTDAEGVGIVYGNIKRIGFESKKKEYLLVVFETFSSDSANGSGANLEVARIDLSSGKSIPMTDPDGSIAKSLESIDSFF